MCRALGLLPRGANFDTLKHAIAKYDIDVSHFKFTVDIKENHGKVFVRNQKLKEKLIKKFGYKCSNPKC